MQKTGKEHALIKHVLLIRCFQIFILQGYGRTLLHQKHSKEAFGIGILENKCPPK